MQNENGLETHRQRRQAHLAAYNEYEAARALFFVLGGNTPENKARFNAAYDTLIAQNKINGGPPYAVYNFDL